MFEYDEFAWGHVNVVERQCFIEDKQTTFQEGFQKACMLYNTCILTVCGSACAIIHESGKFAVDSHACSYDGRVDPEGKSVVLYFKSLDDVYQHFCKLASGFHRTLSLRVFLLPSLQVGTLIRLSVFLYMTVRNSVRLVLLVTILFNQLIV